MSQVFNVAGGSDDKIYCECDMCEGAFAEDFEGHDSRIDPRCFHWAKKDFSLCMRCIDLLWRDHCMKYVKAYDPRVKTARPHISKALRDGIFERDNSRCKDCGSTEDLSIDHIIPFSRGGATGETNLQILCMPCNLKKRDGEKRVLRYE